MICANVPLSSFNLQRPIISLMYAASGKFPLKQEAGNWSGAGRERSCRGCSGNGESKARTQNTSLYIFQWCCRNVLAGGGSKAGQKRGGDTWSICRRTLRVRRWWMNYGRHVRKITRKNCNDEKWNLSHEGGEGSGEGMPGRTPLWASWQGRSGAFNTPFKFIMTFYSLCSMQQAEAGGGKRGEEWEGGGSVEQPNFQRELFKVFAHFSVENAIN